MAGERMTWDNWRTLLQGAAADVDDQGDTRTGCYCRNDQRTLESYHNYIKVCALFKQKLMGSTTDASKVKVVSGPSYMYDLGFIPITMIPSYWDDGKFIQMMYQAAQRARLPVYSRAPVGLSYYTFNSRRSGGSLEWWVSKMDVAERLNISPAQVTFKEVCKVCGLSLQ